MWPYFAFGDLCRLRNHGSNRLGAAGELTYFCNSSVMLELTGRRCCDTAGVNDNGLSYFEDYELGATYECGSVSVDQASIVALDRKSVV